MENLGSLGVVAVVQGAVLVLEHLGSGKRVALGRVVVDGKVEDGWVEGDRVIGGRELIVGGQAVVWRRDVPHQHLVGEDQLFPLVDGMGLMLLMQSEM